MSGIAGKVALTVALATAGGLGWKVKQLSDELHARPPVAVIDVMAHVEELKATNPKGTINEHFEHVRAKAALLAERGYVVMDRGAVLASPGVYEVSP